jgi:hypothetical protein
MSLSIDRKNLTLVIMTLIIIICLIFYFVLYNFHNSEIEYLNKLYLDEIQSMEEKNNNFNNVFLESLILEDSATRDRLLGNYHFDLAYIFYNETLNQNDEIKMNEYKNITNSNCEIAIKVYLISNQNYKISNTFFNKSKNYTENINYLTLIDIYINLTKSSEKLSLYRYNASILLKQLTENITYIDGSADQGNVTIILNLFYQNLTYYNEEIVIYEELLDDIEEFDLFGFNPNREPPL